MAAGLHIIGIRNKKNSDIRLPDGKNTKKGRRGSQTHKKAHILNREPLAAQFW